MLSLANVAQATKLASARQQENRTSKTPPKRYDLCGLQSKTLVATSLLITKKKHKDHNLL